MAEEAVAEAVQDTTKAADETVTDATATEEKTLASGETSKDDGGTLVSDESVADVKIELKLPDDTLLDADAKAAVVDFATEHKLSNEQAEAIAARDNRALLDQAEADTEMLVKLRTEWRTETENDPEIGGDHLQETVGLVGEALKGTGGNELKELLNQTGYGNHVAVIRFLRGIGKSKSNDNFPDGKEATVEKTMEELFYPDQEE